MISERYYLRGVDAIEAEISALGKSPKVKSFINGSDMLFVNLAKEFLDKNQFPSVVYVNTPNAQIRAVGHPTLAVIMSAIIGFFAGLIFVLIRSLYRPGEGTEIGPIN